MNTRNHIKKISTEANRCFYYCGRCPTDSTVRESLLKDIYRNIILSEKVCQTTISQLSTSVAFGITLHPIRLLQFTYVTVVDAMLLAEGTRFELVNDAVSLSV